VSDAKKHGTADGHLLLYISEDTYEGLAAGENDYAPPHEPPRPRPPKDEPSLPLRDEPVLRLVSHVGPERPKR
jgi:hypothetical protein